MQVFEVRAEEMTVDNLAAGWRVAGIALHPHLDVAYMALFVARSATPQPGCS